MSRYNYSCANECGDEDCGKCMKRGIIFECPPDCTDYEPNFPVEYRHKPKEKKIAESGDTIERYFAHLFGSDDPENEE